MSEGNDGTSTLHGQSDQDSLQPHSPVQQQSNENFNGIGENGSSDLGAFGNVAGGVGGSPDTSGSAAGATGGGMEQEAPGYGSTGQQGYGDQSGALGGSTGGQMTSDQPGQLFDDGSSMSQEAGNEIDPDASQSFLDNEDEEDEDLGDGASAASAAGSAI